LVTAAVVSRHSIAASNQHQDGANKKLPHAVSIRSVSGEITTTALAAWRYSPRSFADPKSHFRDSYHSTGGRSHIAYMGRIILGDTVMKTLLVAIAFAVALVVTSQAFAADLPDCPSLKWKNGHYVCDEQANS
jgi:hypothetical protein